MLDVGRVVLVAVEGELGIMEDAVGEPVVVDDDWVVLLVVEAELGVMAYAVVELVGEVVVDNVVLVWINLVDVLDVVDVIVVVCF